MRAFLQLSSAVVLEIWLYRRMDTPGDHVFLGNDTYHRVIIRKEILWTTARLEIYSLINERNYPKLEIQINELMEAGSLAFSKSWSQFYLHISFFSVDIWSKIVSILQFVWSSCRIWSVRLESWSKRSSAGACRTPNIDASGRVLGDHPCATWRS